MSIVVSLTAETEQKLRDRAARSGRAPEALASELIERSLRAEATLDDVLAPFRAQVAQSGISDEELTRLFEEARNEVHDLGGAR
jgi:plasmid stability protein